MHTVAVLALDDVIAFDLATPIEVFGRARLPGGEAAYRVIVAGPDEVVSAGPISLNVPHRLDAFATADTIIVPGLNDPTVPIDEAVIDALRSANAAGTRIASICVGALSLAATGLLEGRSATTHWRAAELLSARYPAIDVHPDVLFVDEGQLLTSAGAAAGLDLCLHMIRTDYGSAVARDASRAAVMPMSREGGQAQFISHRSVDRDETSFADTLRWIEENSYRQLTVSEIAAHALVSTRTLNRRFQEQTRMTPLEWIERARIDRARSLLETTRHPVERVAHQTGFGSAANFRARFRSAMGTSPAAYRLSFTAPEK